MSPSQLADIAFKVYYNRESKKAQMVPFWNRLETKGLKDQKEKEETLGPGSVCILQG